MGRLAPLEISQGFHISLIRAEDNGEEHLVMVRDVVVVLMDSVVLEDVEDSREMLEGEVPLV